MAPQSGANDAEFDARFQLLAAGCGAVALKARRMADFKDGKSVVSPSDILGGPPEWPKEPKPWDKVVGDSEIIFEDSHVVVFHDPVDEADESPREPTEIRATLLSKKHVHSLMDLGVADEQLSAKILHGIQQAAYRLGLERKGFEVRAHVYPPMQHRPELAFKLRSGKPPKKGDSAAG